jgi:hypothetical protein
MREVSNITAKMAPFMPASGADSVPIHLQEKKDEAIRTFCTTKFFHGGLNRLAVS